MRSSAGTGNGPMPIQARSTTPSVRRWCAIDQALKHGRRGLPGDSSLASLLARLPGRIRVRHEPTLTVAQILAWADAWHERVGDWPSAGSERVPGPSGIRWNYVD